MVDRNLADGDQRQENVEGHHLYRRFIVVIAFLLVHTNKLQELWFHAIEYGLLNAQAANTPSKMY